MLKFLVNHLIPVLTIFAVILLFIPIPEIFLDISFPLIWGFCMLLFFTVRKSKEKMQSLPRTILYLSLLLLALEISYSRVIVNFESRIRMNPETIFKFMFIINIIVAVMLLLLAFRFVRKRATEEAEAAATRFPNDVFYSNLEDSEKFLAGNMKAQIFMYVVSVAGGCLNGVLQYGYSIQEALNIVSLPALLFTIIGSMCTTLLATCIYYSTIEKE